MSCYSHFNNDNNNNNNNNNYIPSFYGDMPYLSRQPLNENAPSTRAFGAPHTFTFSYPTQGTTIPTPRPSIQTTSSMPFVGALGPGLGTTWQHSNPSSMMTHSCSQLRFSSFTGMPARSDPQPSCSSPVKRPKRKAVEYSEDAPSSKVYLCTDQFANLNLNNDKGQHEVKGHDPGGWGRFQEVENSIECDVEQEETRKKEKGVLRFNDDTITDAISTQSSSDDILPRNVLKEIVKPCMQVVLWKSPGELVRDLVREDSPTDFNFNSHTPSPSPSVTDSLSSSSSSLLSGSFDKSSKLMPTSNHRCSSYSGPSNHSWPHPDISSSPSSSSVHQGSSLQQLTPSPPQTEWNALSSSSLVNKSKSNIVTMSHEGPGLWDNHLDLNCDEDMQL